AHQVVAWGAEGGFAHGLRPARVPTHPRRTVHVESARAARSITAEKDGQPVGGESDAGLALLRVELGNGHRAAPRLLHARARDKPDIFFAHATRALGIEVQK